MRIHWILPLLMASQSAVATPVVEPGKWQISSRLVSEFDPVLPVVERPRFANRRLADHTICVIPKTPLATTLDLPVAEADGCRYNRYSVDGGKFDVSMTCKVRKNGPLSVDLAGVYTADRYEVRMTTVGLLRGTVTQIEGKRLGSC